MTGAAGSANGNANVSVSASEACNPGTLQAFTYWWGQECNSPCPPPHCWTGLPGSSIGWGNGHPSETAGCWPRGLSTNSTSWTFAQSSNYTSCIAYNNPYYFMVVQNNYNPGVYLYSGIWAINVGGTCWPYGQSPW
jgi:hypothetical protein